MLQNRVDPMGNIIRTSARGSWMGNRGLIHNDRQEIIRPFKLKAWITCRLEFKNWKRKVMTPNRYTELFFMDEATAFAAGHRPCSECRREAYLRFKACWLKGNPAFAFNQKVRIGCIDEILHKERISDAKTKVSYLEIPLQLPEGTFVLFDGKPCLLYKNALHPWSPAGYLPSVQLPAHQLLPVLTPASIINTFRAGYEPQINL